MKSRKFQIGDRVKVADWTGGVAGIVVDISYQHYVVALDDCEKKWFPHGLYPNCVYQNEDDMELLEVEMSSTIPFKVGDRVKRVDCENTLHIPVGSTGVVIGEDPDYPGFVRVLWDHDATFKGGNYPSYLQKIEEVKVPEVKIEVAEYKRGFEIKDSGERKSFASGMVRDVTTGKIQYHRVLDGPMFKRWAEHLTKGATKYPDIAPGKANWTLAKSEEERQRFKESALRHFIAWYEGETDEDHAAGVFFNINGAEYTKDRITLVN